MEYWKHDWEGWRAGTDLKENEDTTVLYATKWKGKNQTKLGGYKFYWKGQDESKGGGKG